MLPPNPPAALSVEARREWRRLAKPLHAAGILTEWDRGIFAAYCTARANFNVAARQLAQEGLTFRDARGVIRPHPCIRILRDASDTIRLNGERLSLDPFSRSRHAVPNPQADIPDLDDVLGPRSSLS
jgi:P27 family predicted phage terminase small subunit